MFKSKKLNEIANECGLHIDPHNMEITYAEIEFFVEQVLEQYAKDMLLIMLAKIQQKIDL